MIFPFKEALFPAIFSISIPIVILDGKAFGFMITSGTIPVSVKGISTYGQRTLRTPFCPCLELNLSPIIGFLGYLTLYSTFKSLKLPLSPETSATPSNLPDSLSL